MQDDREARAKRRSAWPGGLVAAQTPAQLPTPAERLGTMWQLALDAWAASGRPLPEYRRENAPGHVLRPE